jgi:hypothetical protein
MGYKLGLAMQGFNDLTLGGNVQAPAVVSVSANSPALPLAQPFNPT